MSINVNDKNLGHATAYAYYKAGGGTMTEAEFTEFMADFGTASQTAVEAAQAALASKNAAQTAATTATNKATEATTAATTATNKAAEAQADADAAALDASQALSAASTATTKATEATTAAATATSAKTDAVAANTAAQSAKTAAQTAQTGAETAAASVEASAEQIATNAEDISQLKSDFADMESDGVAPSAEQILTDKGVTDSVPYHYRKTGGDGADRLYDQIVGGSLAVNQLVQNGNFSDVTTGWTANNGTVTASGGKLTFSPTAETSGKNFGGSNAQSTFITVGHKYFFSFYAKVSTTELGGNFSYDILNDSTIRGKALTANVDTCFNGVVTAQASNRLKPFFYPWGTSSITADGTEQAVVHDVQVHDLTQMFGTTIADYVYGLETATAGAGVAWLKSHFPRIFNAGYVPYNAGELVSVQASAHKMVGFNQWDEEWEVGRINGSTGALVSGNGIRSKNYIPVFANTSYYVKGASSLIVCQYDENKNFISTIIWGDQNKSVLTSADAKYLKVGTYDTYGNVYKNDICINLSDPTRNGEYEPYKAHSYPLDSTLTLRGIPKLDSNNKLYFDGDTYDADGTVTRKYGIVDLGTLNWVSENSDVSGLARADARNFGLAYYSTPVCSKFNGVMPKSYVDIGESEICFSNSESLPLIRVKWSDLSGKTNAEIISALTGVMFVYELETPTTEEADPYQHLQQCDPNGTEEYVSTGIVPVGHNTKYPDNLRMKLDNLPWNFANLIAPTESAFTATRNYVTGDLFIVDNVLYKATSNIANGGTITPNTNCTATTLAEIISALA